MNRVYYENLGKQKIGEIYKLKCGATAKIIDYRGVADVDILILENGEIKSNVRYDHIKEGYVRLKYFPIIYGIGYIGDESDCYNFSQHKAYITWKSMFQRCYDKELEIKYPNYIRATVCKEWHNYSNFKKWFDENYYEIDGEIMCLDKDLLLKGNKIYSPDNCIFAPERINYLFVNSLKPNRNKIIGIKHNVKLDLYEVPYRKIKVKNKVVYTISRRVFNSDLEAFEYFKQERENSIRVVADFYKNKIPQNLYRALYDWKVEITD